MSISDWINRAITHAPCAHKRTVVQLLPINANLMEFISKTSDLLFSFNRHFQLVFEWQNVKDLPGDHLDDKEARERELHQGEESGRR